MAGICDKALKLNYPENKYRYNGGTELQNKEFSDGSGLELYDANARMYDPQIGRFGGIDAMSDQTRCLSPYQFAYNDPTLFNDPGGMKAANPNSNTYNSAEQQYINGLANPMGHEDDWGEEFMAGGGGGGGFDENGNLITPKDNQDEANIVDPQKFLLALQRRINEGSIIDILNFITTGKENYYGTISYTPPTNGTDTKVQAILLESNMGSDNNQESNASSASNADGDNLTWGDYAKTSLALVGAIIETAAGGLTSETGVGAIVAGDGAVRVAGNIAKLVTMIESGSKSKSGLVPTNGGAIVGAIWDHGTGNTGQMQSILGGVNDIGSMFISVESDYELLNTTDHWLNHWNKLGPYPGIYDDYQSIKENN